MNLTANCRAQVDPVVYKSDSHRNLDHLGGVLVVEAGALGELLQLQVGEFSGVGENLDLERDHFVVLGVLADLGKQEAVTAFVLEVDLAVADADAGERRLVEERADDLVETQERDVHLHVELL